VGDGTEVQRRLGPGEKRSRDQYRTGRRVHLAPPGSTSIVYRKDTRNRRNPGSNAHASPPVATAQVRDNSGSDCFGGSSRPDRYRTRM